MMTKRALISVYDKSNILSVATFLKDLEYEIISTGGTASYLETRGISVIRIEDLTGWNELLEGRVKTLSPILYAGILARRTQHSDMKTLESMEIQPIDLVIVNLYPFESLYKQGLRSNPLMEMVDIGGVSLIRAAAKNYPFVTVITDPKEYDELIRRLPEDDLKYRKELAGKAFSLTASYDSMIAHHFNQDNQIEFPELLTLSYHQVDTLRYGENPHQRASVYKDHFSKHSSVLDAKILHGKQLSYNNIRDTEAAIHLLNEFDLPTVVVIKHMNPCGVASKATLYEAWQSAHQADQVSIFGGVVATNQKIDLETAKSMQTVFLEIIIAKDYEEDALNLLKQKKNLRILIHERKEPVLRKEMVSIEGGMLLQDADQVDIDINSFRVVTERKPSIQEINDLLFAYKTVKHVKSNAIVIAKDEITRGVGAGQMNRVGAAEIALKQAGVFSKGAVLASDGFIPMIDTVILAYQHGITSIIQPGGSIADLEVIRTCHEYNIAMIFSQTRHFKH
jgi:phosphoribosylaminoimidazolecarboxamide formyltransferase / IMP cyclohydrolase